MYNLWPDKIIEKTDDGDKLELALNRFSEIKTTCFDAVEDEIIRYQTEVRAATKEKIRYITYCTQTLRNSELDADKRSVKKIEEFISFKKHQLRDLEKENDMGDQLDEYERKIDK